VRFSIITPSYNGGLYLEKSIKSVLGQRCPELELEYIVVDGGSTDDTHRILAKYEDRIDRILVEQDTGPANAINKGFRLATGDVIAWLNVDDLYFPGTLLRVQQVLEKAPESAFCFGSCLIVDEQGEEIRSAITRFKEMFFPVASYFTYQCINYLSQPALFFTRSAVDNAGALREDMVAAWDYDYILKLWHSGLAARVTGAPLAAFRWHEHSISGQNFKVQFQEEYEAVKEDAGSFSLQTCIHFFVRWGIVGAYSAMSRQQKMSDGR
jgi:glycosyltransferase involved in cell wall biosynthesis